MSGILPRVPVDQPPLQITRTHKIICTLRAKEYSVLPNLRTLGTATRCSTSLREITNADKVRTRQAMCVQRNIEVRSPNHSCSETTISITYSEFVFVHLGIQHVVHMRNFVIRGLSGSTILSTLPHKRHDFRKKLSIIKCVF